MKKLIKLSLLAVFLGIHPTGCYNNDCNDFNNHAYYISAIKIETKNIPNLGRGTDVYHAPSIETTKSYHVDSIGFLMSFEYVDLASVNTSSSFLGFQNIAMACSPSYRYHNPIENILVIYPGESIIFNDSISLNRGDTITSMFNISSTFSDYSQPQPLETYSYLYQDMEESLLIRLSENNQDSIDFRFDLITTLTDGKVFKSESLAVKLLPSE